MKEDSGAIWQNHNEMQHSNTPEEQLLNKLNQLQTIITQLYLGGGSTVQRQQLLRFSLRTRLNQKTYTNKRWRDDVQSAQANKTRHNAYLHQKIQNLTSLGFTRTLDHPISLKTTNKHPPTPKRPTHSQITLTESAATTSAKVQINKKTLQTSDTHQIPKG